MNKNREIFIDTIKAIAAFLAIAFWVASSYFNGKH